MARAPQREEREWQRQYQGQYQGQYQYRDQYRGGGWFGVGAAERSYASSPYRSR
jgi:hypothetical protein